MSKNDKAVMTMQLIEVKKADLMTKLQQNRETHRADFERAIDGWEITVKAKIAEIVERAKKNDLAEVFYHLQKPEDHTKDYDRTIGMLELDIHDTVELSVEEFAQYVQDDWGWKRAWTTSNSTYLAASSR